MKINGVDVTAGYWYVKSAVGYDIVKVYNRYDFQCEMTEELIVFQIDEEGDFDPTEFEFISKVPEPPQ